MKFKMLLLIALIAFSSCKKDDDEASDKITRIQGYVKHHDTIIPNALIYVKQGANEFPGGDVSVYNSHVIADSSGFYEFSGFAKGNYYLYGVGYDAGVRDSVFGGIPVQLNGQLDAVNFDIPVTE